MREERGRPPQEQRPARGPQGRSQRSTWEPTFAVDLLAVPNGSRLSCGAKAGGRKRPALRYELVGAQTHASPESRPRQLQALVRPHRTNQRLEGRDRKSVG